jgi:hypothetical protein
MGAVRGQIFPCRGYGQARFPLGLPQGSHGGAKCSTGCRVGQAEKHTRLGSVYDHIVRSEAELDAALRERMPGLPYPSRIFRVHKSPEPVIRRMWNAQ